MSTTPGGVVQGTLRPDGTLVLDEKPTLSPGRVVVTLLPADGPFWQRMQAIWEAQKARGHVPRSREEIDAELRQLDEEMEQEIEEAIRLQEESRRLRLQADRSTKDVEGLRPRLRAP